MGPGGRIQNVLIGALGGYGPTPSVNAFTQQPDVAGYLLRWRHGTVYDG